MRLARQRTPKQVAPDSASETGGTEGSGRTGARRCSGARTFRRPGRSGRGVLPACGTTSKGCGMTSVAIRARRLEATSESSGIETGGLAGIRSRGVAQQVLLPPPPHPGIHGLQHRGADILCRNESWPWRWCRAAWNPRLVRGNADEAWHLNPGSVFSTWFWVGTCGR